MGKESFRNKISAILLQLDGETPRAATNLLRKAIDMVNEKAGHTPIQWKDVYISDGDAADGSRFVDEYPYLAKAPIT